MKLRRGFACVAMLFLAVLASPAGAALTTADRSPFWQGHWWSPQQSGSGLDLFNTAGQVMAIWYTYDEAGHPTWYTAQGSVEALGSAWPLMRHRWTDGHYGGYAVAGTMKLAVVHPESIQISWSIGSHDGSSTVQPFVVSGVRPEIDHSGSWFDPSNSGWGLSVTHQGDVLGGVFFTYDPAGAPTWTAGFDRATSTVQMYTYNGACPWCAYRTPTTASAGRATFDFIDESHATFRHELTAPMAAGVNANGARITQLGRPASARAADRQLVAFDSERALKAYLDAGMLNVAPMSGGDFSAPPPPSAYSPTNVQEAGVDEADLVKTDGSYVYTFAVSGAVTQPAIRIAQVSPDGTSLAIKGTVALPARSSSEMGQAGLYLQGDKLVAVTGSRVYSYGGAPWMTSGAWTAGTARVEVLDAGARDSPAMRWQLQIDGFLVSSRLIGSRLYVVTRSSPSIPGFTYGAPVGTSAFATNQSLLANTPLASLLPGYRVNGGARVAAVAPADVLLPPQGGRPPIADTMLVTAVDLDKLALAGALAIVGTPETFYASTQNLYIATSRYTMFNSSGMLLPVQPSLYLTDLHQIRIGDAGMAFVGSGTVEGNLGTDPDKASFRMSDYQGRLRVVTSSATLWSTNQNRLTVLEPSDVVPGFLRTLSYLPNPQRPETLGKPNEFLYATRFLGDRLYAVTFKKIDPLYVVDISNPGDPRIAGSVALPGFSDYLHPLANGLLLGFGKDAIPASVAGDGQFAWYQGLRLGLFDVSDPNRPRELQSVVLGKRGSDSALLHDHHAFSMLAQADGSAQVAIPVSLHDGTLTNFTDSTWYPWTLSGVALFQLTGLAGGTPGLAQANGMLTHTAVQPYPDPGANGGRSIVFPQATLYVGAGQFWWKPGSGNTLGPY